MNITEASGINNKVGGSNFPSIATIRETLFMHRPDYQPDAIIRYSISDILTPSGERLDNVILMSYEFDDGAVVFGAYEPFCDECNGTGLSLHWTPTHGTWTDLCYSCHVEPETAEPYASGRLY